MFIKQIIRALPVILCTVKCVMPCSIQLNTQFGFGTIKIKNIWSDTELATKLISKYLTRLYTLPQHSLCRFTGFTQLPACVEQFTSVITLVIFLFISHFLYSYIYPF